MVYTIQKILEFHDLFPKEKDLDVRTILKKYSREYIAKYEKDGIHWSFDTVADFNSFMKEHYRIPKFERQKLLDESLNTFGLKKIGNSVNWAKQSVYNYLNNR